MIAAHVRFASVNATGLILCLTLGLSAAEAAVISGRTVRLNGVEPEIGVQIIARRIRADGEVSDDVVGAATSRDNGQYSIDIGTTRVVQLEFRNSVSFTKLEKVVGLNDTDGLTVAVPVGAAGKQQYLPCPPQHRRHRLFRRFRCASYDQSQVMQIISSSMNAGYTDTFGLEFRWWTDKTRARSALAGLVSVEGEYAIFRRLGGELAKSRLDALSVDDRKWIANWLSSTSLARLEPRR